MATKPIALLVLTTVLLLSAVVSPAGAANLPPIERGPHAIPRVESTVKIDGLLDEAAWEQAWSKEMTFEVRPGENVPAPVRTVVHVIHDEHAVYFGFKAYDPDPSSVRAHLSDRDNVGADDWVAVILDTFNDERRSFDFLVNPLGVQEDFVETESGDGGSWDTIWESAGRLTEWGYSVEMRIPFSSLRFQRSDKPQIWGFDAVRAYPRNQYHHIGLFPRDRSNNCYLCQAVKIEGFEGANPGKNLEIVPTFTTVRTDMRNDLPGGDMAKGDLDPEAGLTARWGMTPNLTLSGTLNPDFSQVEADARQLDVNEPFALSYAEKRPFFMEGADFFSTPLNAIYTRSIRDPDWGAKLSGKAATNTLGAYLVEDDVTNLIFPGSQGSEGTTLTERSTSAVLRYKRDIGNRFTLGGLFTGRVGSEYSNQVLGFDSDLRLTDKDRVRLQLIGSRTNYPDSVVKDFDQPDGNFGDWAGRLSVSHSSRRFEAWGVYKRVGTGFRADLGFMPQAGVQTVEVGAMYKWIPNGQTWYSSMQLWAEQEHEQETNGLLLNRSTSLNFEYEGFLQSHSYVQLFRRTEGYGGQQFDINDLYLHTCLKPDGNSYAYFNLRSGDRVDYANTRLGHRLRLQPGVTYKLGRRTMLDLQYLYERMNVPGGRLYTARIGQGTIAYQFTSRAFLRLILQHEDDDFNLSLYDDPSDMEPEVKDLFTQVLFSYKLNPHTVLFLGYTEGWYGTEAYELTSTDRTFFVKIGYAWTL